MRLDDIASSMKESPNQWSASLQGFAEIKEFIEKNI